MRRHLPFSQRRQRGAAALIVTMLLFFAMVLAAVFVNRNLVFEQRSSANQYRSTQAFEAAEAGLEWTLAQLNLMQRVGADCLPSDQADAVSFRERYLRYQNASASFSGVTWANAGSAVPLQPSCVRDDNGWNCSCPASGQPALLPPTGSGPFPAFTVQLLAGPKPGTVRVVSTGCSSLGGVCRPGVDGSTDASAKVEVALGLLGGLRSAPAATLTLRGSLDAGSASLGLHNADPATGVAVDAGGAINATQARVTPPAGGSVAFALADHDAALASIEPDRLFATHFGLSKTAWKNQPAVRQLTCSGGCGADLIDAIGSTIDQPLIWISGDAHLDGPLTLGTPQRPVVIVVAGSLQLQGAVVIHGLVHAQSVQWNATPASGAWLRGAMISESGYSGDGTPDLAYDAALLAALKGNSGSFARISGSWRDF